MNVAPWDEDFIKAAKEKDAMRQLIARQSNANGKMHEKLIEGACRLYRAENRAYIVKEPEPFHVLKKNYATMKATVQLGEKAQPDFHGTLRGGRSIVFEAKFTEQKRMKRSVISERQTESLDRQGALGAAVYVCAGIGMEAFMVPWDVFKNMKAIFGRQFVEADDLEPWQVYNDSVVRFLDYIHRDNKSVHRRLLMQEGSKK